MIDQYAARLRKDATALAGRSQDLVQRASVYFHLYQHSGGRFCFPLLAAHGALWGAGHFARGIKVGRVLSCGVHDRTAKMSALNDFANALKEINRRVCVETYVAYHLTLLHGDHPEIARFVDPDLATALNQCHRAATIDPDQKRDLFQTFFLWEQHNVVGPGIDKAVAQMDWPLIMWLAMKPPVNFRYFHPLKRLWFRAFDDKQERIDKGFAAFDIAAKSGWTKVESDLRKYGVMPKAFLTEPAEHFASVQRSIMT